MTFVLFFTLVLGRTVLCSLILPSEHPNLSLKTSEYCDVTSGKFDLFRAM